MDSPLLDRRRGARRLEGRPGFGRRLAARLYRRLARWEGARRQARRISTRIPVLSLGNLELGGTGKTPALAAIARLLSARGLRAGLVTGMTGPDGGHSLLRPGTAAFEEHAPDEARWLAQELPGLPLVAARRKWEGALALDGEGTCDLICVDDGFQHRRLSRCADLLLLSGQELPRAERVLPAGPFREGPEALARADAFGLPAGACLEGLPPRPCFRHRLRILGLVDLAGAEVSPDPAGYLCISAIARPERYEKTASEVCMLLERIRFEDHSAWGRAIRRELLAALARRPEGRPLLNAKDAARWGRHWDLGAKSPHVLRVSLEWEEAGALIDWIEARMARSRLGGSAPNQLSSSA